MEFGVFFEMSVPRPFTGGIEARVFHNALEQARLADALGFDTVWAVEHHFLEEYSHCSAPEVVLSAVAAQTQRPARIHLSQRYDGVTLRVMLEGREALAVEALRPEPLAPGDVQYTGTLTLTHTPPGLRLVQVEPHYALERAERVRPRLTRFDAEAWGHPALSPYHPVSASIARADVTLPPIRFVCRPDVPAFAGTESVGAPSS